MQDDHSAPAPAELAGKITRISVTYNVNTADGVRHTFHSLQAMTRHAPADRVRALIEILTEICEEVLAGRGHSVFGLPKGTIRQPFAPMARPDDQHQAARGMRPRANPRLTGGATRA